MKITLDKIWKLVMNGKGLPSDLRLYLITGNNQIYINKGHAMRVFSSEITENLTEKREKILEPFTKIEFIIDELLRLHIIGFRSTKEKDFLNLIDFLGASRKISLLYKWEIFSKNLKNLLDGLIKVRNGVAHDISLAEVEYKNEPIFKLVDKENFKTFKKDLKSAWSELTKTYMNEEEKIDWDQLITELEAYQRNLSSNS